MGNLPVSSSEIHLLNKEMEAQGELISKEKLDRIADVDRIEIEISAIITALSETVPDFVDALARAKNGKNELRDDMIA